ncbi:MAG: GDSL-type esterase/lipase family protein [Phycisphaerae bacterium]
MARCGRFVFGALILAIGAPFVLSQSAATAPAHSAVTPAPRSADWWTKRHEALCERARAADAALVFIGDSITQGWETAGKDVWGRFYDQRGACNLGISGDRTQHVLWRLDHGALDAWAPPADVAATRPARQAPKLAVLMIGTNNSNGTDNTPGEIADGITAIVGQLRARLPGTRVLVLGIFPRGEKPNPQREKNADASARVAKLADGKMVHYLDIGRKFLDPDGVLEKDIMPDLLHLSPRGYEIWAEAIEPTVKELLGE